MTCEPTRRELVAQGCGREWGERDGGRDTGYGIQS